MLAKALSLSLRQMAHPATLRLVVIVALLTVLIFGLLGAGLWQAIVRWGLPRADHWLTAEDAAGIALVGTVLASWFLFRAVAVAVMGLFSDGIIASVEEDHYPAIAARAVPVPAMTALRLSLRSLLRAVGWNLLALPVYVGLLITGIGTPLLVLLVNAILLRRDFEDMVAARHPDGSVPPLTGARSWLLGLASSVLFLVPFVNLFAPVFGAALAVHLHHLKMEPRS